jgi:hypothetical protein
VILAGLADVMQIAMQNLDEPCKRLIASGIGLGGALEVWGPV